MLRISVKPIKVIFTCLLLAFITPAFPQTIACDSIIWKSNRKLTWNDFKAEPDARSAIAAKTRYNFTRTWGEHNYVLKTTMLCFFSPCLSWSKNKSSDRLLIHEQGHFDIAEYFRRLYNKRIAGATLTPSNLTSVLKNAYRDVNKECEAMQEKYDNETRHSLNVDKQTEWTNKIAVLLNSLKDFDQEEVVVQLPH